MSDARMEILKEVTTQTPEERVRYLLKANGAVYPGINTVKGCELRASISTLRKLEREGVLVRRLGMHGGPIFFARGTS